MYTNIMHDKHEMYDGGVILTQFRKFRSMKTPTLGTQTLRLSHIHCIMLVVLYV